jgi:apolipoprotein N-acyltransferase
MRRLINLLIVRFRAIERGLSMIGRSARTGRAAYLAPGGAIIAAYLLTRPPKQRQISKLKIEPGTTMLVRVRQADEEPLGIEQARALLGDQTL